MNTYRKGQEVCEERQEGKRILLRATGRDNNFVKSYRKGQEVCGELQEGTRSL